MPTVTLQQAQAVLPDLIHRLAPGGEIVITENDRPIARLLTTDKLDTPRRIPRLGTLRGSVLSMEHFNDPLDDFKEYTE